MELDMTKGSPSKLITKFIIPIIIGNIFQQLYSMVDTIIVGGYWNGDQWQETENFGPGANFRAGIYHVKLDMNTNTCTFTKKY